MSKTPELRFVRYIAVFSSLLLTSCLSFVDKDFATIEASMPALSKPELIVGMWYNKQEGGLSGFHENVSNSILFRSDGSVHYKTGGNRSLLASGGNSFEAKGMWRYDSPGKWIVKMKGYPQDWIIRTDGGQLLCSYNIFGTRVRSGYVRADDEAAIRAEQMR